MNADTMRRTPGERQPDRGGHGHGG